MRMHTNIQTTKLFSMIGGGCGSNIDSKPFICETQIGRDPLKVTQHVNDRMLIFIIFYFPTPFHWTAVLSPSHSQQHRLLVRGVGFGTCHRGEDQWQREEHAQRS